MAVSKRLRYEILRRDNHACRYCGGAAPDVKLTVDHVVPTALGGSDEPRNLVTACADCNNGKSATPPDAAIVAEIDRRALTWATALTKVSAIRAQQAEAREEIWGWFNEVWCRYSDWRGDVHQVPDDWIDSVARFLEAGLSTREVEDMVSAAMRNRSVRDKWRYFCGCCHTRIRQNIDLATEIAQQMEDDDGA